jgi:hypothetical protein
MKNLVDLKVTSLGGRLDAPLQTIMANKFFLWLVLVIVGGMTPGRVKRLERDKIKG